LKFAIFLQKTIEKVFKMFAEEDGDQEEWNEPEDFGSDNTPKLLALNSFRRGDIVEFETKLRIDTGIGYSPYNNHSLFYSILDGDQINDLFDYTIGMIGYYKNLGL
jgi:hypothetical protein